MLFSQAGLWGSSTPTGDGVAYPQTCPPGEKKFPVENALEVSTPRRAHGFFSEAPRFGVLDGRRGPRVPSMHRLREESSVLSPHPTPREPQIMTSTRGDTPTPSLL